MDEDAVASLANPQMGDVQADCPIREDSTSTPANCPGEDTLTTWTGSCSEGGLDYSGRLQHSHSRASCAMYIETTISSTGTGWRIADAEDQALFAFDGTARYEGSNFFGPGSYRDLDSGPPWRLAATLEVGPFPDPALEWLAAAIPASTPVQFDVEGGLSSLSGTVTADLGAGPVTVALDSIFWTWPRLRFEDGPDGLPGTWDDLERFEPGCAIEPTSGAAHITWGGTTLDVITNGNFDGCVDLALEGQPIGLWCGGGLLRDP